MTVLEKRKILRRLGEAVQRHKRAGSSADVGYSADERTAEAVVRELRAMGLTTVELDP